MTAPGVQSPQLIAKGNLQPLQEKQGVHELEPKSDDGELSGLCETMSQIHFRALTPPQRNFNSLFQQKSPGTRASFVLLIFTCMDDVVKIMQGNPF